MTVLPCKVLKLFKVFIDKQEISLWPVQVLFLIVSPMMTVLPCEGLKLFDHPYTEKDRKVIMIIY